jgi:hypothetical protein
MINIYTRYDSKVIKLFFIKLLVRVINKHYVCSVKGILSEPTERPPHTRNPL